MNKVQAQWYSGGASVIGAAHVRRNLVNQDAISWYPRKGVDDRFVIAVADGHGGSEHFRAEFGAKLALQAVQNTLDWYLDAPDSLDQLSKDLIEVWQNLVRDHVASHPFDRTMKGSDLEPYGSTLVTVAATASHCLALQIGDGDLFLGFPDGQLERPLADDTGLVGEQTYSLCMHEASRHIRSRLYEIDHCSRWPDFALIATDGVSKSFVDDDAFKQVVQQYRELVQTEQGLQSTLAALPDWLGEVSNNGSGDDASLCIATQRQQ